MAGLAQSAFLVISLWLVLAILTVAQQGTGRQKLVAVEAGTSLDDIGEIRGDTPLKICPENYPNGFSVRCEGDMVRPPVKLYIDDSNSRYEGRAPYHIEGDLDIVGLRFVFPWHDYLSVPKRADGTRLVRVGCQHRSPTGKRMSFSRSLIIAEEGCGESACQGDPIVITGVVPDLGGGQQLIGIKNTGNTNFTLEGLSIVTAQGQESSTRVFETELPAGACTTIGLEENVLDFFSDTLSLVDKEECVLDTRTYRSQNATGSTNQVFDFGVSCP